MANEKAKAQIENLSRMAKSCSLELSSEIKAQA